MASATTALGASMRIYRDILAVVVCLFAMASCSTIDSVLNSEQIDLAKDGKRIISTTAGQRHTIVSDRSGRSVVCTEPPPDAATSVDVDMDFSLTLINLSGDDKGDDDQDVQQEGLGGRSANVLMVRDLLYRTCELFMNSNFTDDQKAGLFRDVLRTIERIGPAQIDKGTAPGQRQPVIVPAAPTTSGDDGDGGKRKSRSRNGDQTGNKDASQACASNPEGSDCGSYCSQNASSTVCTALCTSTGDFYGWCRS